MVLVRGERSLVERETEFLVDRGTEMLVAGATEVLVDRGTENLVAGGTRSKITVNKQTFFSKRDAGGSSALLSIKRKLARKQKKQRKRKKTRSIVIRDR